MCAQIRVRTNEKIKMNLDDLLPTIRRRFRPFSDVAGSPQRGLGPLPTARLMVDKTTRDRFVLFDPSLAPLLRRIVRGGDVRPWYCETQRYLIMYPQKWIDEVSGATGDPAQFWQRLAERCPPLWQHLASAATRPIREVELPTCDLALFAEPRIVWPAASTTQRFALTEPGDLVGPGAFHASGSLFLLGVLMSRLAWVALTASGRLGYVYRLLPEQVGQIPVPDATDADRVAIETLVQRIVTLIRERTFLERQFTQRLVKDFGPPGATPSEHLERWWELDFGALRKAIDARFGGDIPARFRDRWAAHHTNAVEQRRVLNETLAHAENALNVRVFALYGIEPGYFTNQDSSSSSKASK